MGVPDGIVSGGAELIKALLPPGEEGELPVEVKHWRVAISWTVLVMAALGAFHIAWACGALAYFGLGGFAQATDLKLAQDELRAIRLDQIDRAIRDDVITNCQAQAQGNGPALRFSSEDLAQQLNVYQGINGGKPYPRIPGCNELITVPSQVQSGPQPPTGAKPQ